MDLSKYKSKKVRIDLVNGYFYEGFVTNVDDDSLEIRDRNENLVTLTVGSISFIREVNK